MNSNNIEKYFKLGFYSTQLIIVTYISINSEKIKNYKYFQSIYYKNKIEYIINNNEEEIKKGIEFLIQDKYKNTNKKYKNKKNSIQKIIDYKKPVPDQEPF